MKKVVILNGNHLCNNPRVLKEAGCLSASGYDVEVLGGWIDNELAERDRKLLVGEAFRFTPVVRMERASIGRTLLRGRRWTAMRAKDLLGLEFPGALGYGGARLLEEARSRDADLYIAHSELTLWVARSLALEGRRVGVDMEDWFSEDLPAASRRHRPVKLLRQLEREVLAASVHRTCTSVAMAEALALAYECPRPQVVYNAFPWSERDSLDAQTLDRKDRSLPSIHWYSQSIGPGRGLEDLFAALAQLDVPAEIHLRGNLWEGYRAWLADVLTPSWRERVFFHPTVPNGELLSRIAEHDIGLSLDPAVPASRDLTVTNKILQYMQAGLAVVASATSGQREIASAVPGAIRLYSPGDPGSLASILRDLVSNKAALAGARRVSLEGARDRFCWEKVAPILVACIERAIRADP